MKAFLHEVPTKNWAVILFVVVILIGSGFGALGLTGGLITAAVTVGCVAVGVGIGVQLRRSRRTQ